MSTAATEKNGKAADAAPSRPEEAGAPAGQPATPNPAASRQQTLTYGIVGEPLEQVTRRVPLDEPPPLPENARLKVIGKPLPRLDAVQKVTGAAHYTFDVKVPGMLYARRVTSTVAHARIVSIDTAEAEKYPGVRAVHVLDHLLLQAQLRDPNAEPANRYPTVRYLGQPLAAVAADTQRAADAAALLVKVTYEPLPHVTTLDGAKIGRASCRERV